MIVHLPEIYPDELVYSWFCRYYIHSGYLTHKKAMMDLFCKKSDNISKEFIGNLNCDAKNAIKKMSPPDALIMDHTMFPLYARFLPPDMKRRAIQSIWDCACNVHHLFYVPPRLGDERFLRYCPICAKDDRQQYGEAYWHRRHQIHGIPICTKHRCKLKTATVTMKSEHDYVFCPAEEIAEENNAVVIESPMLISFACYIEDVFDAPLDYDNCVPISAVLYDGLSRTGYVKQSSKCRNVSKLIDDMDAFYKKAGIGLDVSAYQIQRVLLSARSDFFVVCQIAFYLGIAPSNLTAPSIAPSQIQKEQESHYMRGTVSVDWATLDSDIVQELEAIARDTYYGNEHIRPERISERFIYRKMGLKKHQLENLPKCRAVLEKYAESYPESWARKMIWAYQRLRDDGTPLCWSEIRTLSGVKKKNFQSTIPFLQRHADEDTKRRLIEIVGNR